jgi:membrane protease YdiL (CAAX protease family)
MIQFQNWIQPAKIAIPILFMLVMFSWARKKEVIRKKKIRPIIIARCFSASVFVIFALPTVNTSVGNFPSPISFTVTVILCLAAFVIVKNFNRINDELYPEVKHTEWNGERLIVNDLSWILYMFGYEFFFRGFMLSYFLTETPMTVAVALNVLLYAVSHIPKGHKEVMLSIPFGVLLCWITIYTESIWCAFFIHTALALSNEWFSIRSKFFSNDIQSLNPR